MKTDKADNISAYQSGYLTIKNCDQEFKNYTLYYTWQYCRGGNLCINRASWKYLHAFACHYHCLSLFWFRRWDCLWCCKKRSSGDVNNYSENDSWSEIIIFYLFLSVVSDFAVWNGWKLTWLSIFFFRKKSMVVMRIV